MESFTADFIRFVPENLKIWILGGRLGTRYQIQAFQSFSCNFLISKALSRSITHEATRTFTSDENNLVQFHLWQREITLKSEKVCKCFVQDCP